MDDLDATQTYTRNFSNWKVCFGQIGRVLIEEEMGGVTYQHIYYDSKETLEKILSRGCTQFSC
jgi:hypothetical protein